MTSGVFRAGNYSAMLKFIRAFARLESEFKKNLSLAIIGVTNRKEFISKAIEEGNKIKAIFVAIVLMITLIISLGL
jgi:hypothetical protein